MIVPRCTRQRGRGSQEHCSYYKSVEALNGAGSLPRRRPLGLLVGGAVGRDGLQLVPAGVALDLFLVARVEQVDEVSVLTDGRLGPFRQVGEHRVADAVKPLIGL